MRFCGGVCLKSVADACLVLFFATYCFQTADVFLETLTHIANFFKNPYNKYKFGGFDGGGRNGQSNFGGVREVD